MSAPPVQEKADCGRCDAVCCRLLVLVDPEDGIAEHLTTVTEHGLRVMARDEDGWCVAVDAARMRCSIYEARPDTCRRFHMGGPYCEAIREDYARGDLRGIPLALIGEPA
jgi:Fe-S-cluster containining protein